MSPQVPRPMFVDCFSTLAPWYDSVIVDDAGLSTVGNDGSECSVGDNTILTVIGDASVTGSSDVALLHSRSSSDKRLTWSNFMVSVDKDGSIEYKKMSVECRTANGSVGVSESKIPVELENGNVWQPSREPCDCHFYLHQRAFRGSWGAGMQWWSSYVTNMGCGGYPNCKNMSQFYWRVILRKSRNV